MKWILMMVVMFFSCSLMAKEHKIRMVAEMVGTTKFWMPTTIVVKKGDTLKISAINKIPGKTPTHGLQIMEFGIEKYVGRKEMTFSFVANKAGVFPINCNLHPAHHGGQLIVLE